MGQMIVVPLLPVVEVIKCPALLVPFDKIMDFRIELAANVPIFPKSAS